MSRSKNNVTGLVNLLSQGKAGGKSGAPSLPGSSQSSPDIKTGTTKVSNTANNTLKSQSLNVKAVQGLQFGKPSSNRTSTAGTSTLSSLLKSTESSGLSSLLGGGGLLGGLTGLGSLTSLVSGLFGGGTKTLPPLTTFTLPQSVSASYSVGSSTNQRSGSSGTQTTSGIYGAPTSQATTATVAPAPASAHVAQAVKTALLSSSSLNDVINEL